MSYRVDRKVSRHRGSNDPIRVLRRKGSRCLESDALLRAGTTRLASSFTRTTGLVSGTSVGTSRSQVRLRAGVDLALTERRDELASRAHTPPDGFGERTQRRLRRDPSAKRSSEAQALLVSRR
jgi:hypothetical protein